ncbi:hypothetical protein ACS0TY_004865 [Phlomoides rotata]
MACALLITMMKIWISNMHSSYLYHFDTNNWNAVYKHRVGKDYKFKAGYDSDVRLGWASLWDE